MATNLVVFVRSIAAFFFLFLYARILGKTQMGQLTFFDYAAGITIGSMAASMSTDLDSIGLHHWVGLTTWFVLVLALQIASIRNRYLERLVEGEPTVVIHNGQILERNLEKLRYPYSDLMSELRGKNVFDIGDVEFALLEPTGKLSVLLKSDRQPITPKDLNISTHYEGLTTEIISSGQVIEGNLAQLGLDHRWLKEQLQAQGIDDVRQVAFAVLDSQGNLYVDKVEDDIAGEVNDPSDYQGPN
ncbi:MAG: DUF421 domain-containing protein [Limnochordia bacterium]|jgi:uncharacterized membrane protein YcaP (DUF421 family)